jgi:hypothetical protein
MTAAALRDIATRWAALGGRSAEVSTSVYAYDAEHARHVARWYIDDVETMAHQTPTRGAQHTWARLADIVALQYADVAAVLDIAVTDSDPYADAEEMRADVERGHLSILATGDDDHPLWTPGQNDQFRAVHDALGHAANGVGFDRYGEDVAYRAHAATMPRDVLGALATETRGQNAALVYGPDIDGRAPGTFARQACVLAPSWVWGPGVLNAYTPGT